jgi:hypothetical protein
MAETVDDAEFAAQNQTWIDGRQASKENKIWNERYYLNYYEPARGENRT